MDPWASMGIEQGAKLYTATDNYITDIGNFTYGTCGFVTVYDQEEPFSEDHLPH